MGRHDLRPQHRVLAHPRNEGSKHWLALLVQSESFSCPPWLCSDEGLLQYFSFLVYFVHLRNLFARLRSPEDFAVVQTLSTLGVCVVFPFQMTALFHKILCFFTGYKKTLEEHREAVAISE